MVHALIAASSHAQRRPGNCDCMTVGTFWETERADEFRSSEAHERPVANSARRSCRRHLVFGAVVRGLRACAPFGARRSIRAGGLAGEWLVVCDAGDESRA